MIGLSGLLAAAVVFIWAGAVAFWSRRWAVWAVTILSLVTFYVWSTAIESGHSTLAVWIGAALCFAGLATVAALFLQAREETE